MKTYTLIITEEQMEIIDEVLMDKRKELCVYVAMRDQRSPDHNAEDKLKGIESIIKKLSRLS